MSHMAKIIPNKPVLIMLYGFPGAGKTAFARELCEIFQAAHVYGDRMRLDLFEQPRFDKQENDVLMQLMNYMTTEFLHAGMSVVYDINAMRAKQRLELRELARKSHAQPILLWLQIDPESALTRVTKRDRRRAEDKYAAPIDRRMFEQIAGHMQNPTASEDYVVMSGKHTFKTQFSSLSRRFHDLGVINNEEMRRNVAKPALVNLIPNAPVKGRVDMTRRNVIIR